MKWRGIGLCVLCGLLYCNKEDPGRPDSFLNLKVEGQEGNIVWKTVTGEWNNSLGQADLEATSHYFDRCTIQLENMTGTGTVSPLTKNFYYTDGIDFRPYAISGTIRITEAGNKAFKGTFDIRLENNYNGVAGKQVTGDFGVINKR